MDVFELDLSRQSGQGTRRGRGRHRVTLGDFPEEFPDPLGGSDGLLDLAIEVRELSKGTGDKGGVEQEAGEFSERDFAGLKEPRSGPEDENHRSKEGKDDERDKDESQRISNKPTRRWARRNI